METIQVTIPLTFFKKKMENGSYSRRLHLTDAHNIATIEEDGEVFGKVYGCHGGGYEIKFEGKNYYVGPDVIWNAFCEALGRQDLIIEDVKDIHITE